jgi:peptide deformylase
MYNPELVEVSEEKVHLEEGCLSFPFLFLSITRPKSLVVKFQNEVGDYVNLKLDGISARVVLHELDHLNGVTFDMVAKPLALKMAKRGREKKIKSFAKELVGSRRF